MSKQQVRQECLSYQNNYHRHKDITVLVTDSIIMIRITNLKLAKRTSSRPIINNESGFCNLKGHRLRFL